VKQTFKINVSHNQSNTMFKKSMMAAAATLTVAAGAFIFAADHIDAPVLGSLATGSSNADITDYYAFESPKDPDNYVFVINVNGLLSPAATASAMFHDGYMYEVNIDNNGDMVEDLVLQCRVRNGELKVFGPAAPASTGLQSSILAGSRLISVPVTPYGAAEIVERRNGVKAFAGPRDDPFFFDLFQFRAIVDGVGGAPNPPTAFNIPGADAFAGTNVMSIVVELPKSMLGANSINTWVEAKRRETL
jgi:hypothetical protein